MEQVDAGMRMVRRQERPFLPTPGQFIKWCREGRCVLGITTGDVMAEYWKLRKLVFRYPSSDHYPWPKPVLYHICIEMRITGIERQMTEGELKKLAEKLLTKWTKHVSNGISVPPIRRQLAAPQHPGGLTPAQLLMEEYKRRKAAGLAN
jgi:hypothetical protein